MSTKNFNSINDVPIRLTSERLDHILSNHPELKEYIWELEASIEKPHQILTIL